MRVTRINDIAVVVDGREFIGTFKLVCGEVDFVPRIFFPIYPEFSVWEEASRVLLPRHYA